MYEVLEDDRRIQELKRRLQHLKCISLLRERLYEELKRLATLRHNLLKQELEKISLLPEGDRLQAFKRYMKKAKREYRQQENNVEKLIEGLSSSNEADQLQAAQGIMRYFDQKAEQTSQG